MEYADGGDLATAIKRRAGQRKGYFSEDQICLWFVQICLALWHVHSRGFLHRDLKSQNVFIAKDVVKLGDFGIARMLGSASDMASTSVGTSYYLSPGAQHTALWSTDTPVPALQSYSACLLKHACTWHKCMAPSCDTLFQLVYHIACRLCCSAHACIEHVYLTAVACVCRDLRGSAVQREERRLGAGLHPVRAHHAQARL
jgi:serine/threonine protein kinase